MCQDISIGLRGATSLDSFLKAYKSSETKKFFPYEWFDSADKLDNQKLPPCEAFISKRRNNNAHDKDFKDYQNSGSIELDEQQILKKLQVKTVPASGGNPTVCYRRLGRNMEWLDFKISCIGKSTKTLI